MAFKLLAAIALLLAINLLFSTMVVSAKHSSTCPPPKKKHHKPCRSCTPTPSPSPPKTPTPSPPATPTPSPTPTTPTPSPPATPTPSPPTTPTPSPTPTTPTPSPPSSSKCPLDTLKLGVCANVLGGLLNVTLGKPPKEPCCSLLGNLADLEAAVCLCTALKANILGINLNVPVDLSLLLNYCGKKAPKGFQCP